VSTVAGVFEDAPKTFGGATSGATIGGFVKRVPSANEFLANPMGRCHAARRFCVFAHSPTLLGFASWGRPDVEDVRELLRVCGIGLQLEMAPYRWLVDLRGLDFIEPATFGLFLDYTTRNREILGRNIVRQAQLRPDGFVGAIISGFAHVAKLPYPDRVFGDVEEALGWLEVDRVEGVELLAQIEALRNESRESYSVVARLRHALERVGILSVAEAAQQIGLSTRAFQRALREAGTTYRMEIGAFRVRRAQELLRGERPLAWIAAEIGFSTAQHFATAYRHATGETPSEWRGRHREAAT
jgi:AraC-like DNA-binding protein